ncbi:MAG TPA: translocation/assembly module TamB [Longimicrobiales bacterium]|nr:translocation/assembly module TamB [Longimicrobiales bacterium]
MSEDGRSDATEAAAPPEEASLVTGAREGRPPRRGRMRRRARRLARSLAAAVVLVFALVLGLVVLLTQTERGQRLVIEELLERVRGSLAGELALESVRSRSLLTGVTFVGVRLDAAGGRRALEADSVVVRYSLLSLILGSLRVRSTVLHGMELEISRYPGEEGVNLQRVLAPGDPADTLRAGGGLLQLGRIAVRDGTIHVLTPATDPEDPLLVPGPGGEPLHRLAFEDVDLDLEETTVRPGGAVSLDARLASLSARVFLREQPLVLHEAAGELTFGARGLAIEQAAFRLPGSLLEGQLAFGPERPGDPWTLSAELLAEDWGDLADLAWIDPRVPEGRMRGAVRLTAGDDLEVALDRAQVELAESRLTATGRVRFGERAMLRGLRVSASPLALADLGPWLERELPVAGTLTGETTLSGTLERLEASGELTLAPEAADALPTRAVFAGTLRTGPNPGATALSLELDPLDYRLLESLWPGAAALGRGSARLEIDGLADEGISVAGELRHEPAEGTESVVTGEGVLRRLPGGAWSVDLRTGLAPLELAVASRVWPDLGLAGSVEGPLLVSGRLDDLRVRGELRAEGGSVTLEASLDPTDLASGYRLDVEAQGLPLSELTARVPAPSSLTGRVALAGAGLTPASLSGTAEVELRESRIGRLRVDSLVASVGAAGGLLTIDTLVADGSGVRLAGAGSLGITEGASGEASFDFGVESLVELRPVVMGDSILTRDGLNPLEADLLRARGIDPDTLPEEADVRMAGALRGTADVRGRFGDLGLDLRFEAREAAYGRNAVDSARVVLSASGLPATLGDWDMDVEASGVTWGTREFESVRVDGAMSERRGEGTLQVQRRPGEGYFLTGAFALDSVGGEAELSEASAQLGDLSWALTRPTRIVWSEGSLSVDGLELEQMGPDPMHVTASGTLTRGGDSDFRLRMEGFHVEQALRIAQLEDVGLSGRIDLDLTVVGPAERPVIDARFEVEDPAYGALRLTRLSGSLAYENRSSVFRLDAWDGERSVLTATGTLPLDLALTDVEDRSLSAPMDVQITADSLDASAALAYLESLRDVSGTVSADVHIGGTSRAPEPEGTVTIRDAAWTIEALGVRHSGVQGDIVVRPDLTVGFTLETRENGRSSVVGVMRLEPLTNPTLDLAVTFERFQAVDRRDIEGTISGEFRIRGTYELPVAEGTLQVDEGNLFVDEFARAGDIVDLTDPSLFADGFAVDTTVFVSQPLIAGLRNPFLDNLRVDIDLSVPRNLWLRSSEMDVEMGGELLVRYDRREGDLVLVGDLQALRGSYSPRVLGRTFEVEEGTVSFMGQPGINPTLDITARTRVRRRGGDPLEVIATVQGTLVQPLVTLSTEEAGLAQSDLISYLLFGRASGEPATGGGGADALGSDLTTGGLTLVAGAAFSQVGAAIAEGFGLGLDYLAVSQGDVYGDGNLASNLLASTQLEVGRYFGDDVFVVLVFSKPDEQAGTGDRGVGVNFLRGARVELALTDASYLELFIEDRFLRSGGGGFGTSGLDGEQIVGIAVFREWGYGS